MLHHVLLVSCSLICCNVVLETTLANLGDAQQLHSQSIMHLIMTMVHVCSNMAHLQRGAQWR